MNIQKQIKNIILTERKKFAGKHNLSSCKDINAGYCEVFSFHVVEELKTLFSSDFFDCVCVRDFQGCDETWDTEYMKNRSITPPSIFGEMDEVPFHAWFVHKNIHYDAERPHGVKNFFDLPFFQRYLNT